MSRPNPRRANGSRRTANRNRLRAEGRGCWICRAFGRPDAIDYSLPPGHPLAFEVDELVPVSRHALGGYATPQECASDYANLDAVHRRCNQWRGNRTVAEVVAIARGGSPAARGGGGRPRGRGPSPASRDWRKPTG